MAEKLDQAESSLESGDGMRLQVTNIGGIDDCDVSFTPGVTILTGRNATNRTSLLQAVAGVFGGTNTTLKSDTDAGHVELSIEDSTYRREYAREGSNVTVEGTPYSDQTELVDSFACLLEGNPARAAVEQGTDLRDVLMGPIETHEIERQIRQVDSEIADLEDRIDEIERQKERLPELEADRRTHRDQLSTLEAEIEDVHAAIDSFDVDESEAQEAEQLLDDLEDARSRRRQAKQKLQRQRDEIDTLQQRREELEEELSDLSVPDERLSNVESDIERLEERKRGFEDDIANLTEVIRFNDDLLSGDGPDIAEIETDDDPTSSLDPMSEDVECWTCGSQVQLGQIDDRVDGLREILSEKRNERDELEDRIADLRTERRDLERAVEEQSELQTELDGVEREIDHRTDKAEDLEATIADLEEEIEELEADVEETEELRDSDLADAYQRLNELEYERGQVQQRLDDVEDEIAAIETEVERLDELRTQLSDCKDRREELRTHIEDLERDTVQQFNDHMEELLSILEYDNIARVWIERTGTAASSERAAEAFELHVVRETADGTGYEDTVDNLSESEREIIGLIVGLVGYLVHDVYEEIPVMLLDSLEAIDADRIAKLVDYFAEFAPYLIVALLPEDEQAIAPGYDRIDSGMI